MLGKIIKYDILAEYKKFGVLYIAVIITSVLLRIMSMILENASESNIIKAINTVLAILFTLLVIGCILAVYILAIVRFYKNLMKDEGYLMHTLPVPTWQLILSKMLTAHIWLIASAIVIYICSGIVEGDVLWIFNTQWDEVKAKMIESAGEGIIDFMRYMVFSICISLFMLLSHVYLCFAIGNLSNKSKLGISVLVFIGIYIVEQITSIIIMSAGLMNSKIVSGEVNDSEVINILNPLFGIVLIILIVVSVISYALANIILAKKLNLE